MMSISVTDIDTSIMFVQVMFNISRVVCVLLLLSLLVVVLVVVLVVAASDARGDSRFGSWSPKGHPFGDRKQFGEAHTPFILTLLFCPEGRDQGWGSGMEVCTEEIETVLLKKTCPCHTGDTPLLPHDCILAVML